MKTVKKVFLFLLLTNASALALRGQVSFNGSFEFSNQNHFPARWFEPLVSGDGTYIVSLDSSISYEGKTSLFVRPTNKCTDISSVTIWQEVDLTAFPPCKSLKTVEYIRSAYFDTLSAIMGVSVAIKGEFTRKRGRCEVEKVYNESGLWYKVSVNWEINGQRLIAIPWIVTTHCYPLYVDNFHLFLDDKEIPDRPVNDSYYPLAPDIGWLSTNSRGFTLNEANTKPILPPDEVKNSSIVALGEAVQTPGPTMQLRIAATKMLVEKEGFSVIAIDDRCSLTAPEEKEMEKFLSWVRLYNTGRKEKIYPISLHNPQAVFSWVQSHSPQTEDPTGITEDSLMMQNLGWLTRVRFPGKKMIIWSGNQQISAARNLWYRDDSAYKRLRTIGSFLAGEFKEAYKSYALLTDAGTAAGELPADSYEHYLAMAGKPLFFTSLDNPDTAAHIHLFEHLRWFSPDREQTRQSYSLKFYNLSGNFDGFFFIRH
jgi:hypothetical protein